MSSETVLTDVGIDPWPSTVTERIVAIRAIPYAIPYLKPLRFASGSIDVADNVLVEVETSSGAIGIAEAPPRPYTYGETQESIVAVIERLFAPGLIGLALSDREKMRQRMERTVGNPTAKSAIDMAVWDATGRLLGMPVHRLLGGYTDRLRVSHMLGFDEPSVVAEEALALRETLGIDSFKVKVGRRPIDDDVAVCRAVRDALGDATEIYIDGNRGWSASESARALRLPTTSSAVAGSWRSPRCPSSPTRACPPRPTSPARSSPVQRRRSASRRRGRASPTRCGCRTWRRASASRP
jgi:L-alanine-DL-glutamate epimerase-like enolase superfamily enzyme